MEEEANTPKLRFAEFGGAWEERRLAELSGTITSGSRDWAQYYSDSGPKFIRMTNLPRSGISLLLNDMKYVELPASGSEGARTALKSGDILISITAELGKIGLVTGNLGEAYINQHTALVRPKINVVTSDFLAHFLSTGSSNKRLNRLNDSGAKSGLNLSTIANFRLAVPALPEQKKIAGFLGAVDEKLAALRKKRDLLADYKRGVMQQIFSQTLRFTRNDGTAFPDWEEKRLGEITTLHSSGIYKSKDLYGEGENIIGVGDIFDINSVDGQVFRKVPLSENELEGVSELTKP